MKTKPSKQAAIVVVAVCVFLAAIITLLAVTLPKARTWTYADEPLGYTPQTVGDCINAAAAACGTDANKLRSLSFSGNNIGDGAVSGVRVGFAEIDEFNCFTPYTTYSAYIDLDEGVITSITETHANYISFEYLNTDEDMKLSTIFTAERLAAAAGEEQILPNSAVTAIAWNDAWEYLFYTDEYENRRVEVEVTEEL